MIVKAILNLYTSNPTCPQFKAWAERMKQNGTLVFLHPLTHLKQQKEPKTN